MYRVIVTDIEYLQRNPSTICPSAEVLDFLLDSYFPCTTLGYEHRTVTEQAVDDRRR